jgi:biotin transport system substrate-specific component
LIIAGKVTFLLKIARPDLPLFRLCVILAFLSTAGFEKERYMQGVIELLESFSDVRDSLYRRRLAASLVEKLLLALGMAVVTGLAAQVRIQLPWSPVPITGQTFAVLLAGILLGQTWGGVSMVIYISLGIAGIPWFTGWTAGVAHLAGPTGGYLWGFILAALFVGYITDHFVKARGFTGLFGLMLLANFVIIYGAGLVQLYAWLNFVKGTATGLTELLYMGLVPFIAGDMMKALGAAIFGRVLLPRK